MIEEEKMKIEAEKREIEIERRKLEEERKDQASKSILIFFFRKKKNSFRTHHNTILEQLNESFQLKNWNDIVSLSQGPNSEFRIEIDPDEIPNKIKTQITESMEKFSKLETCIKFQTTRSGIIFELDFQTRKRAEKVYDQIVELLESNQ